MVLAGSALAIGALQREARSGGIGGALNPSPSVEGIGKCPPNCPSSPEARLFLFSGVVRPSGRNGRQRARGSDTP